MTMKFGFLAFDLAPISRDFRIRTERLDLVPSDRVLANAGWSDRATRAEILKARVPANWPPTVVEDPDSEGGWWDWHVLKREENEPVLIGVVGIKGWPAVSGSVQAGCVFLDEFSHHGFATEAVGALTSWALEHPEVERVTAKTPVGNEASKAVLCKLGFELLGTDEGTGMVSFQKSKSA